jgi:hypothetical protein
MSHELNTIAFEIIKTDAITHGMTIDQARKTIIATGSKIWSIEGIATTVEWLNKNGYAGTLVRFTTAQGEMELDGKAFLMWGTRMARLVNA